MKLFKEKIDTDKIIEEIHHSFDIAGDELLREAQHILSKQSSFDKNKFDMLERFGFTKTKEFVECEKEKKEKRISDNITAAIMEAKKQFPTHKYITYDKTLEICKKYNLILGLASQYKGFVPKKNLEDINAFYAMYDEKTTWYQRYSTLSGLRFLATNDLFDLHGFRRDVATKEAYEQQQKQNKNYVFITEGITLRKDTLFMCAPLKDMDIRGYEVKGNTLQHIPDPIVLNPFIHKDVKGFIIVTAWGDESKDPDVINHTSN